MDVDIGRCFLIELSRMVLWMQMIHYCKYWKINLTIQVHLLYSSHITYTPIFVHEPTR